MTKLVPLSDTKLLAILQSCHVAWVLSLVPRPARVRRYSSTIIFTASDKRAKAWERGWITCTAFLHFFFNSQTRPDPWSIKSIWYGLKVKLAYSYSVTCSNHEFCRNCNYYEFETVQHCGGTTTAKSENRPEWRSLVRIDGEPRHAMTLSAVFQ